MNPEAEKFLRNIETALSSDFETSERELVAQALGEYKKSRKEDGRYGWEKVAADIHRYPDVAIPNALREPLKARFAKYATANKAATEESGSVRLFHAKSLERIYKIYAEGKALKDGAKAIDSLGTWAAIRDFLVAIGYLHPTKFNRSTSKLALLRVAGQLFSGTTENFRTTFDGLTLHAFARIEGELHWHRLVFRWSSDDIFSLSHTLTKFSLPEPGVGKFSGLRDSKRKYRNTSNYLALITSQLAIAIPTNDDRKTDRVLQFKLQQREARASRPSRELVVRFSNRAGLIPTVIDATIDRMGKPVIRLQDSPEAGQIILFTNYEDDNNIENHGYFVYNERWAKKPKTRFQQRAMKEDADRPVSLEAEWAELIRTRFDQDNFGFDFDSDFDYDANNQRLAELIQAGVDVNVPVAENGYSALHYVALELELVVLRLLIKSPKLNYLTLENQGKLPLDLIPALIKIDDAVLMNRFLFKKSLSQAREKGLTEEFLKRRAQKFDPNVPRNEPGM
ncbi:MULTISPECIES: hypothetical protein [Alphaproteobacteria]|uniref:hypothetical protein n=1 Tax=Alphaproteobacteria TaxID=28211 RepID=UPI003298CE76